MIGNSTLNKAKYTSDNTDEWYTTRETVIEEVSKYANQFNGKSVLCNCDDPFESAFSWFFLKNFNVLGLSKLVCTSYGGSKVVGTSKQLTLFDDYGEELQPVYGYAMIVKNMPGSPGEPVSDETISIVLRNKGIVKRLKGDGDFASDECVKYLKQCDICVTNPPFSKFQQLYSLIRKYNKQFLLIGNQNAITYKEIFPDIKEGKAWIGYRFGDMAFKVPADTEPRATRYWQDESGQKWRSLGNAMWLTNLDTTRRHQELELTAYYTPEKYPKFDDFDAISVSKVVDIPKDYPGIMGVPLTYLKYHNEDQFEIVGEANHGSDNEFDLFKPKVNGKELFKKILIKNKKTAAQTVAKD